MAKARNKWTTMDLKQPSGRFPEPPAAANPSEPLGALGGQLPLTAHCPPATGHLPPSADNEVVLGAGRNLTDGLTD